MATRWRVHRRAASLLLYPEHCYVIAPERPGRGLCRAPVAGLRRHLSPQSLCRTTTTWPPTTCWGQLSLLPSAGWLAMTRRHRSRQIITIRSSWLQCQGQPATSPGAVLVCLPPPQLNTIFSLNFFTYFFFTFFSNHTQFAVSSQFSAVVVRLKVNDGVMCAI